MRLASATLEESGWFRGHVHTLPPIHEILFWIYEQGSQQAPPRWDFLTNHAHVLVCVARDPGIRLRDIAAAVGITERAAHRIVSELVDEGYVVRERQGRRNRYQVKTKLPLPHPLAEEHEVGDLLEVLVG